MPEEVCARILVVCCNDPPPRPGSTNRHHHGEENSTHTEEDKVGTEVGPGKPSREYRKNRYTVWRMTQTTLHLRDLFSFAVAEIWLDLKKKFVLAI